MRRAVMLWLVTLVLALGCGAGQGQLPRAGSKSAKETSPPTPPPPRDDGRLPGGVAPISYELELDVDPSKKSFTGVVRIALKVTKPSQHLVLHGRDLEIQTVSYEPKGAKKVHAQAKLRQAARSRPGINEELVLTFDAPLPAGEGTLQLQYTAEFAAGLRGAYRVVDGGDGRTPAASPRA